MKVFYLAGSIVFTALLLVLAFENINAQCSNMFFFFWRINQNPTIVSLAIATVGIITGLFYHGMIRKFFLEVEDDADEF